MKVIFYGSDVFQRLNGRLKGFGLRGSDEREGSKVVDSQFAHSKNHFGQIRMEDFLLAVFSSPIIVVF